MDKQKIILYAVVVVLVLVVCYIISMLSPLLDDAWKIIAVGLVIGFALGFWSGLKWKDMFGSKSKDK